MTSKDTSVLGFSVSSWDYFEYVSVFFIVSLMEPVEYVDGFVFVEELKPFTVFWVDCYC